MAVFSLEAIVKIMPLEIAKMNVSILESILTLYKLIFQLIRTISDLGRKTESRKAAVN